MLPSGRDGVPTQIRVRSAAPTADGEIGGGVDPLGVGGEELIQPRFVDGRFAAFHHGDPLRVDVDAGHVVTHVRQGRRRSPARRIPSR